MFKFSIIIPTYNRAHTIERPLNSLVRQTFKNFEVVVVDDGSTDNTEEIVLPYISTLQLKYIKKNNGGKHTALNRGIKESNGELMVILDSDDEFYDDTLEQMNCVWDNQIEKDDLCGLMFRCSERDKLIGNLFPDDIYKMSYIEFHYGKYGGSFKDCCECVRLDILKEYSWPENLDTKFIPENYVFDQIGLKYKLLCYNKILGKKVYYANDGITLNNDAYIKKNFVGYLFNIVSKVDIIVPNSNEISLRRKIAIWEEYWTFVKNDIDGIGIRTKKVTLLGVLAYLKIIIKTILNKNC